MDAAVSHITSAYGAKSSVCCVAGFAAHLAEPACFVEHGSHVTAVLMQTVLALHSALKLQRFILSFNTA